MCYARPHNYKREELVRGVKVRGNLSCSDCEMGEFRILRGWKRAKIRTTALEFRRAAKAAFDFHVSDKFFLDLRKSLPS